MYGLPLDTDLAFFAGVRLSQVCVGENEVILNFEGGISVMVASMIEVERDGRTEELDGARAQSQILVNLLGHDVRTAVVLPAGVTQLTWSDGSVLRIRDTWPTYESYTITVGDRVIVV